jgi:hypothetical protein
MGNERLAKALEQLHTELSKAERLDPETLKLLSTITDDISRLLDKNVETSSADVEPVSSGLKDLLLQFEAEHPKLSARIGEVADALAAMGI